MLNVIRAIEMQTGFHKGKGGRTESVLKVVEGVPEADIPKHLVTQRSQGPMLVVFMRDDHLELATVVADGIQIETQAGDVLQAFLVLLAAYYVFDLSYPRPYSQLLGLFQQYALLNIYTGHKIHTIYSLR